MWLLSHPPNVQNEKGKSEMDLRPIRLGDGGRVATGWLVVSHGAVRAILTPADENAAILGFACDFRVRPSDGCLRFAGLKEAEQYLRRRLEPTPRGGVPKSTTYAWWDHPS